MLLLLTWLNALPHCSHLNGASPECTRRCLTRNAIWRKRRPQTSHSNLLLLLLLLSLPLSWWHCLAWRNREWRLPAPNRFPHSAHSLASPSSPCLILMCRFKLDSPLSSAPQPLTVHTTMLLLLLSSDLLLLLLCTLARWADRTSARLNTFWQIGQWWRLPAWALKCLVGISENRGKAHYSDFITILQE